MCPGARGVLARLQNSYRKTQDSVCSYACVCVCALWGVCGVWVFNCVGVSMKVWRHYRRVYMPYQILSCCMYGSGKGGRGPEVSGPLLAHDVGFLTLGPKLDPLLCVDPSGPPPLQKSCIRLRVDHD